MLSLAGTLIVSLAIGSFLNVVIYRLPLSMFAQWKAECKEFLNDHPDNGNEVDTQFNIAFPSSHCPSCKAPIRAWQNIPVFSYLILKGRCHSCNTSISIRYPIVEMVTGILSVFCIFSLGLNESGGFALLFTWCLIALTMIDIDHQLLPDSITLPLMWGGIVVNSFGIFTDIHSAVYGAIAGYLVLWCVFWLFKLITGKEGMGFGDFKLLAALGAWMGWQMLPLIIILSSFVGAVIGIAGIVIAGRDKNVPIPFGPYLAIAGWMAFFWGESITEIYLSYAKIS
ncbi:prepilin peptidase [Teredinibacter purpureus]|uniref:prepilin peptidase n=1 Tax=Teredinibacter purpureus TaxID=2731756 RepID=UPI001F341EC4|nr:A24 family peptidase [Teredinibacter purpureus]